MSDPYQQVLDLIGFPMVLWIAAAGVTGIVFFVKDFRQYRKFHSRVKIGEVLLASAARKAAWKGVFRCFGMWLLGGGLVLLGIQFSRPFQPIDGGVVPAGFLTVQPSRGGKVHVRFEPTMTHLDPIDVTGKAVRFSLVGGFVDCPKWFGYLFWSSRHRVLGIHFEKGIMDFPTQSRLRKRWLKRSGIGYRIMETASRVLPCKTYLRASASLRPVHGRYVVRASSKGYIFTAAGSR